MATLTISYFGAVDGYCAVDPIGAETVTISGASAQSGTVKQFAKFAKINSDTACYVTQGANPTATATNGAYIPASGELWVRISQPTYKFAAITA